MVRRSRSEPDFDCLACGACCCSPDDNRSEGVSWWVEIGPDERILRQRKTTERYVIRDPEGVAHLRMHDHRCAALRGKLGQHVHCVIYEARPRACRRVEAGDESCRQYRLERGIDAG